MGCSERGICGVSMHYQLIKISSGELSEYDTRPEFDPDTHVLFFEEHVDLSPKEPIEVTACNTCE